MLTIKGIEVFGLQRAMLAAGNPMTVGEIDTTDSSNQQRPENLERGKRLGTTGSGEGHDNFLKGIIVQFDVKYPQYWTPEAQRYHWLDIVSSQSKMHRLIMAGSSSDFASMFNKYVSPTVIQIVQSHIDWYNQLSEMKPHSDGNYYSEEMTMFTPSEQKDRLYRAFMEALSNLPMGYEMWETLSTNYLQLKGIYKQRKNHKLKEDWGAFTKMCEELPLFLELIQKK